MIFWIIGAMYPYIPVNCQKMDSFILGNVTYYVCDYDQSDITKIKLRIFILVNFVITYLVPLCTITISYVAIMFELKGNHFTIQFVSENRNAPARIHLSQVNMRKHWL